MQKIKSALPSLISLALAAGMVAAAELLHEKEIIFPEITAIAIGALAAPRQVWNTSRLRLLLTITACAAAGVGVVCLVPLPLAAQIPIGLILAFALITASGTEFLPAVSACVLPVLLGTRSPVYILSVIVMTSLILGVQLLLEKAGMREKYDFRPVVPDRELLILRGKQIVCASMICLIPALLHEIFFIAPPLIVGFAEMSKPSSKLREKAPVTVGLIALAAAVGCASRYVICVTLGLPLTIAAVLSCGAILIAVNTAKLYFPPCGAAATLPFIIPEAALLKFPFELTAGYVVLTAAVFLFFGERPLAPVRKIAALIRR